MIAQQTKEEGVRRKEEGVRRKELE